MHFEECLCVTHPLLRKKSAPPVAEDRVTLQPCQPLDIQDTRMPDRLTGGPQDVKDNHEEAAKVAPQALRLCELVRAWLLHTHKALPESLANKSLSDGHAMTTLTC